MDQSASKDSLLRKADALLADARRARKSASLAADGSHTQLIERAQELERQAGRLEKDAIGAKNGVFAPYTPKTGAAKTRTA